MSSLPACPLALHQPTSLVHHNACWNEPPARSLRNGFKLAANATALEQCLQRLTSISSNGPPRQHYHCWEFAAESQNGPAWPPVHHLRLLLVSPSMLQYMSPSSSTSVYKRRSGRTEACALMASHTGEQKSGMRLWTYHPARDLGSRLHSHIILGTSPALHTHSQVRQASGQQRISLCLNRLPAFKDQQDNCIWQCKRCEGAHIRQSWRGSAARLWK